MNENIFKKSSVAVYLTFVFLPFNYLLGVYGECYRSGAKIKCTDTFEHEPLTLEIDVKSCKAPVKINVKLDIRGVTHNKEFTGDQDIPLPELSISGLTDIFLTVNAYPQDNGDLQLQVRYQNHPR